MENKFSITGNNNSITNNEPITCLICWDEIGHRDWSTCVRCHIYLHNHCEQTLRGNQGYTKCPHCQRVGCLGSPHYE